MQINETIKCKENEQSLAFHKVKHKHDNAVTSLDCVYPLTHHDICYNAISEIHPSTNYLAAKHPKQQ